MRFGVIAMHYRKGRQDFNCQGETEANAVAEMLMASGWACTVLPELVITSGVHVRLTEALIPLVPLVQRKSS
jgi:hypothetical protein